MYVLHLIFKFKYGILYIIVISLNNLFKPLLQHLLVCFCIFYFVCVSAQKFQHSIDAIFRNLSFVYVYIDDMIIASDNEEQYKTHLEILHHRDIDEITIAFTKCDSAKQKIKFLGQISGHDIITLLLKV